MAPTPLKRHARGSLPLLVACMVLGACVPGLALAPTQEAGPTSTFLERATSTPIVATTGPIPSLAAPTASPTPSSCLLLWLGRPIPPPYHQSVDPSYRFGSTQDGRREPHHGVEFYNPEGTPIVAAAPGTVVFAGRDDQTLLGPMNGFYGNAVVLRLDRNEAGQPIFLLHGHLSEISVSAGQHVAEGELLGKVGATGVAVGAHLHFEIRVGENRYDAVRNPELWLRPLGGPESERGAIAGRVTDSSGDLVAGKSVTVRKVTSSGNESPAAFVQTYSLEADTPGRDPSLLEDFALDDLEPGRYEVVSYSPSLVRLQVTVMPGRLTWVGLDGSPDPLPVCGP